MSVIRALAVHKRDVAARNECINNGIAEKSATTGDEYAHRSAAFLEIEYDQALLGHFLDRVTRPFAAHAA